MASITELKALFASDEVKTGPLIFSVEEAGRAITVLRILPPVSEAGISRRSLRKAGYGEPQFAAAVYVTIALPDDASRVAGLRRNGWDFAWSRKQWREMDPSFYGEVEKLLSERFKTAVERNEERRQQALRHMAALKGRGIDPVAQQAEQDRILDRLPTHLVDAYIVEQMGCAPERFAAFGKATRRDWRRRARQEMTAKGLTLH
jgi:hypothetical protein